MLELDHVMDQMEGQWMPQAGLSICFNDPTAGQSQLPEPLRTRYMLGSGWMLHTQYLSVTDSDLFMQMKSISRMLVQLPAQASCSHPAYCGLKLGRTAH